MRCRGRFGIARVTCPLVSVALVLTAATTAVAVDYPVVDTGQTQCYDDQYAISPPSEGQSFYGQDAQCEGNQPSYTLSGDGLTVYDNVTGLTWMASPDGDGDGVLESPEDKMSWWDALDYPATLNAESFGGYSDWRLPSVKELYSLIDFRGLDPSGPDATGTVPFIDTDYFGFVYGDESDGERIIDTQYWTSTENVSTVMDDQHGVFGVNFADGRIKCYPTDDPAGDGYKLNFVLCCRGNTNYGVNSFEDNGDGTVTDRATGLMWQQADSGSGMQWEDALAYAEGLSLAGHDDWRLPNAKELESIVDYTRSPGYTNSAAIDPIFSCTWITNEELDDDYPWYWTGTTHASESAMVAGRAGAYVCFGRGMGYMFGTWVDAHGAGCQRSDPKSGSLSEYTYAPYGYYFGMAPQGDAIRLDNYVRCVRDAGDTSVQGDSHSGLYFTPTPNPSVGSAVLQMSLPGATGEASCDIYDVSGRHVRALDPASVDEGIASFQWDGTTDLGDDAASGIFFARAEHGDRALRTRIVLLR